jgi:ABC-type transport system involved in multi-copper enzyme maturation permease subunit
MSLHPPRYSLPPPPLRPHSARVEVVLGATFRERLGALNIVLLTFIFIVVLLQIIVPFYLASLVPGLSNGPALTLMYLPFSSQVWFFFQVLFTASIGAGVVANDVANRSITMYLARPITHADYLAAKSAAIGLWLVLAVIAPGVIGSVIVLALGYVSLWVALQAVGAFLAVGLLTLAAFTGLTLLVSAWSPRASYAAAAVFGLLVGAEVMAVTISAISGQSSVLYVSVEENVLAVAQWAFGVSGGPLDPAVAAAILAALALVTFALTYRKLASVDAVAE